MKKIIKKSLILLTMLLVTACGKVDYQEKLQENDWQMMSVNGGDVFKISFASETAVIESDFFSTSTACKIEDDNLIELTIDDDTLVYEIEEKNEDELLFRLLSEEDNEEDIILIPLNKNTNPE